MHSKRPFQIFLFLSFLFLAVQLTTNLIVSNYLLVHIYFGMAFPLLIGYFPWSLLSWRGFRKLPINIDFKLGIWSFRVGVIGTFLVSFINEAIDDPIQNGIPFLEAWHHFAADMFGIFIFALAYFTVIRRKRSVAPSRSAIP